MPMICLAHSPCFCAKHTTYETTLEPQVTGFNMDLIKGLVYYFFRWHLLIRVVVITWLIAHYNIEVRVEGGQQWYHCPFSASTFLLLCCVVAPPPSLSTQPQHTLPHHFPTTLSLTDQVLGKFRPRLPSTYHCHDPPLPAPLPRSAPEPCSALLLLSRPTPYCWLTLLSLIHMHFPTQAPTCSPIPPPHTCKAVVAQYRGS